MPSGTKNTVKLKNYSDIMDERLASAAITPGMLIELISTNKVRAHATSDGAAAPKQFACEDELQGNTIDTAYSADNPVQVWTPQPGDEVYAILVDGENVAIGDKLVSNGDGNLKKREGASSGEIPHSIIGTALEAVDLSDSSGGESSGALGYNKRIGVKVS